MDNQNLTACPSKTLQSVGQYSTYSGEWIVMRWYTCENIDANKNLTPRGKRIGKRVVCLWKENKWKVKTICYCFFLSTTSYGVLEVILGPEKTTRFQASQKKAFYQVRTEFNPFYSNNLENDILSEIFKSIDVNWDAWPLTH